MAPIEQIAAAPSEIKPSTETEPELISIIPNEHTGATAATKVGDTAGGINTSQQQAASKSRRQGGQPKQNSSSH